MLQLTFQKSSSTKRKKKTLIFKTIKSSLHNISGSGKYFKLESAFESPEFLFLGVCDVFRKNKKVLCRPLSRAGNGEIEVLCDWAR